MSRSFGLTRLTTVPPIAISPAEISSRPAIMRSSVDLPQPDGPTSTQNSPFAMSMSTPRITCVDPNHFSTAAIVTAAIQFPSGIRSWRTRSYCDGIVGTSTAEPAHDILHGLVPQLFLGFDRKKCRMGREDNPRIRNERRIARHRLDRQHVERGTGHDPRIQRPNKIPQINDGAARGVDERHSAFGGGEETGIDHAARFSGERRVQ